MPAEITVYSVWFQTLAERDNSVLCVISDPCQQTASWAMRWWSWERWATTSCTRTASTLPPGVAMARAKVTRLTPSSPACLLSPPSEPPLACSLVWHEEPSWSTGASLQNDAMPRCIMACLALSLPQSAGRHHLTDFQLFLGKTCHCSWTMCLSQGRDCTLSHHLF